MFAWIYVWMCQTKKERAVNIAKNWTFRRITDIIRDWSPTSGRERAHGKEMVYLLFKCISFSSFIICVILFFGVCVWGGVHLYFLRVAVTKFNFHAQKRFQRISKDSNLASSSVCRIRQDYGTYWIKSPGNPHGDFLLAVVRRLFHSAVLSTPGLNYFWAMSAFCTNRPSFSSFHTFPSYLT